MSFSRASTTTLGHDDASTHLEEPNDHDAGPDRIDLSILDKIGEDSLPKRLIIAIDFGTTYSAVSYVAIPEGCSSDAVDFGAIRSIENYPENRNFNSGDQMAMEVPSEVMYPLDRHFRDQVNLDHHEREFEDELGHDAETGAFGPTPGINLEDRPQDGDGDISMLTDLSDQFRWGYQVHELWSLPATHSDKNNQPLSRFKLLLDNSETTADVRAQLNATLDTLRSRRVVKGPLHVIADFLTYLLEHTQYELQDKGFDNSYRREIVLCVPAIWTQKACRDMQTCLAVAMKRANFQGVDVQNNSIENLFIVSEPEAAAAYMLTTSPEIKSGDTFVLLDAGGGTVDANTYEVSSEEPLRLSREVVPPGGGLHGSSYLNEGFRAYLRELLAEETYLERGADTINGIVEMIMIDQFEYRIKRSFDCSKPPTKKQFAITGLQDNARKGFKRGSVIVPTLKISQIFRPHLEGIGSIMKDQIRTAMQRGCKVEKVVLIGGFGTSVSLIKYLEQRLEEFCQEHGCHSTLMRPEQGATIINAVATGAVIRALNKAQGPQRIARSSYGIMRTEPFKEYPEHEGLKPSYDRHDGQPYIRQTVDWVLKLGEEVPPVWQCEPFTCSHTFDVWPQRPLICKEILFVSDQSTRSHYRLSHPNNHEKVGEIVVDFSFLRDQGLIMPTEPSLNKLRRKIGTRHFKVNFTMAIRVVDRDLECKFPTA
ncbi:hypothetical protein FSARC_646 [Fusarium sarcochroum]|uniref:Hsp70 protein n=1 Tax=Fusarium sarcochroum TaxID=1208366 RepID=A0A8H4XFU6_9HYPO|nr:hypothetical protein FSARC_646 [Fusarium sarcochroum]